MRIDMYRTFISIMFAACLGLLLVPLHGLMNIQIEHLLALTMLLVVLSLWWWYAIFFSRVLPARKPLLYILDFLVLVALALACRLWPDAASWSMAASVALVFMLARFVITRCSEPIDRWLQGKRYLVLARHFDHPRFVTYRTGWFFPSDKTVLTGAIVLLVLCAALSLTSAITHVLGTGGAPLVVESGQTEPPQLNSEMAALHDTDPSDVTLQSIATQLNAVSHQVALIGSMRPSQGINGFTVGVLLITFVGVGYTAFVALFCPEASESIELGRPLADNRDSLSERNVLVPAYSSESGARGIEQRFRALAEGRREFLEHAPLGLEEDSTVHTAHDTVVQAYAMARRHPDNDLVAIRLSAFATYFIHWFDDIVEKGEPRRYLEMYLNKLYDSHQDRYDAACQQLFAEAWPALLGSHVPASSYAFIGSAPRRIARNTDASKHFIDGLKRVAVGAVLLNYESQNSFFEWMLRLHKQMFKMNFANAHAALIDAVDDIDDRTLALTTKPVQECWDVINTDSPSMTLIGNIALIDPVLRHNGRQEQEQNELARWPIEHLQKTEGSGQTQYERSIDRMLTALGACRVAVIQELKVERSALRRAQFDGIVDASAGLARLNENGDRPPLEMIMRFRDVLWNPRE